MPSFDEIGSCQCGRQRLFQPLRLLALLLLLTADHFEFVLNLVALPAQGVRLAHLTGAW